MRWGTAGSLGMLAVGLAVTAACGQRSALPVADHPSEAAAEEGPLPFDRQTRPDGISPSSDLIPPPPGMPAGTPITIRLQQPVSSATAHAGDAFRASLVEPIIVNGQTIADRGTTVMGRVMEAVASQQSPGYLRLALASIFIEDTPVALQSSSAFVKGVATRPERAGGHALHAGTLKDGIFSGTATLGAAKTVGSRADVSDVPPKIDVTVGSDRSLTFRLRDAVTLPR